MSRVWMTGGTGFVGSNILMTALERGHDVFDHFPFGSLARLELPGALLEESVARWMIPR